MYSNKIFIIFSIFILTISLFSQHIRNDHWYQRNQQFTAELDSLATGGIIFLGNSITEGFDFSKYFSNTKIINRGIISDHIDGLIERLETSVIKLKPKKLFILIGINDIGAGDPDSTIIANYSKLLSTISFELPETQVFVHSIFPTSPKWKNCPQKKIMRLNKTIRILAQKFHFTWIDIYSIFIGEDHFIKDELTSDGLHLNHNGYLIWAKKLQNFGLK